MVVVEVEVVEVEVVEVVVHRRMPELIGPNFQKADKSLKEVHSSCIHYYNGRKPQYLWDILYSPLFCHILHHQSYICVVLHMLLHPRNNDNITGILTLQCRNYMALQID